MHNPALIIEKSPEPAKTPEQPKLDAPKSKQASTSDDHSEALKEYSGKSQCTGLVSRIEMTIQRKDGVWRSVFIDRPSSKPRYLRVVGFLPEMFIGETIRFTGTYHGYSAPGAIFEATHAQAEQPRDPESIINYLQSLTRCTRSIAIQFVEMLGEDPAGILDGPEDQIWKRISSLDLGEDGVMPDFVGSWKSRMHSEYILETAKRLGISVAELNKLKGKLGPGADIEKTLESDPYIPFYLGVLSLGRCRKLAEELGVTGEDHRTVAALIYRSLLSKYNSSPALSYETEEVFDLACRSLNIGRRHSLYSELKGNLNTILDTHLKGYVTIYGDRLAMDKIIKLEETLWARLKEGLLDCPDPIKLPVDEMILAKLCNQRFDPSIAQVAFAAVTGMTHRYLQILNLHTNNTLEPVAAFLADLYSKLFHVVLVVPSRTWEARVKPMVTANNVEITTVSDLLTHHDSSQFPRQLVIVTHANQYSTPDLNSLLDAADSKKLILMGDSQMPAPRGHGSPFSELLASESFFDVTQNLKPIFIDQLDRRQKLIRTLENGTAIEIPESSDINKPLIIANASKDRLVDIGLLYHGQYAKHRKLDLQEVCIVTDDETGAFNKHLADTIINDQYKAGAVYGGQYVVTGKAFENLRTNDSVVVDSIDEDKVVCKDAGVTFRADISQLSSLNCGPVKIFGQALYDPVKLLVLMVGTGTQATLNRSLLTNYIAMADQVVIVGRLEFFKLSADFRVKRFQNLAEQGFLDEKSKQVRHEKNERPRINGKFAPKNKKRPSGPNIQNEDSDIIDFD